MSYASQAAVYREMDVMSASPGQLVVMLYDHLLVSMRRARIAMEARNVEQRVKLLDKSRTILSELLVTLDHEKGGDVAKNLSGLYTFLLSELVDVGIRSDVRRMERLTGIVAELRDAFATIAGVDVQAMAS